MTTELQIRCEACGRANFIWIDGGFGECPVCGERMRIAQRRIEPNIEQRRKYLDDPKGLRGEHMMLGAVKAQRVSGGPLALACVICGAPAGVPCPEGVGQ